MLEELYDAPRTHLGGEGGGGRRRDGCDAVLRDVARSVAARSPAFAERFEVLLLGDGRDAAGGDLVAQAAALLAIDFGGCMSRTMLSALICRRSATTFKLRALAVVERCGSRVASCIVAGFAVATPKLSAEIVFLSTTARLRRCGFGGLIACCVAEGARELGLSALHVAAAADTVGYWRRMRLGGERGDGFTESPAGTLALFTAFGARFQGVAMMRAALPQIGGAAVAQGVRGLTLRIVAPVGGVREIESSVGLEEALCSLQLMTCAAAVPLPGVAAADEDKDAEAAAAPVRAKDSASALCSLQRERSVVDDDAGAALLEHDAEAGCSSAIALRWSSLAKLLLAGGDDA